MAEIVYIDDIISEMSEELEVDEKQLREIIKLNIDYLHSLTQDPNVISITLPKLGVLHFNQKMARGAYLNSAAYKKYTDVIDSQIDIVNDIYEENKNVVHKRRSYFSTLRKFFFKSREERKAKSKKEVYKKLEIKQNKIKT